MNKSVDPVPLNTDTVIINKSAVSAADTDDTIIVINAQEIVQRYNRVLEYPLNIVFTGCDEFLSIVRGENNGKR